MLMIIRKVMISIILMPSKTLRLLILKMKREITLNIIIILIIITQIFKIIINQMLLIMSIVLIQFLVMEVNQ
jgi:hypothetical protein